MKKTVVYTLSLAILAAIFLAVPSASADSQSQSQSQSQNQSQSQSQSSHSSSSSSSSSTSVSKASVKVKVDVDKDKGDHDKKIVIERKVERKGDHDKSNKEVVTKRLPATGPGTVGLVAIAILSVVAAFGIRKASGLKLAK